MASYLLAKASVVFYGAGKVACVKRGLAKLVGSLKIVAAVKERLGKGGLI